MQCWGIILSYYSTSAFVLVWQCVGVHLSLENLPRLKNIPFPHFLALGTVKDRNTLSIQLPCELFIWYYSLRLIAVKHALPGSCMND